MPYDGALKAHGGPSPGPPPRHPWTELSWIQLSWNQPYTLYLTFYLTWTFAGHQPSSYQTYSDIQPISRKPSKKSTTLEGQTLDLSLPGSMHQQSTNFSETRFFLIWTNCTILWGSRAVCPGMVFTWFWIGFGSAMASFWVFILATFLDSAKKAQPYKNVINSNRIEGGAPRETTKKLLKRQRKSSMRTKTELNWILT